jgi:hypothetical protein
LEPKSAQQGANGVGNAGFQIIFNLNNANIEKSIESVAIESV